MGRFRASVALLGVCNGADPQELARLAEGAYTMQAFLGSTASNTVKLRIKKGASMNADTEGLFYRLDHQYEKLLAHAQGMTARDANEAAGWIYQGDALEGLNRDAEALAAYRKALSVSNGKAGNGKLVEAPVYIQEKIIGLLRKKSGKA
jgi:tetratricopeptide (TPR) repeat protein